MSASEGGVREAEQVARRLVQQLAELDGAAAGEVGRDAVEHLVVAQLVAGEQLLQRACGVRDRNDVLLLGHPNLRYA